MSSQIEFGSNYSNAGENEADSHGLLPAWSYDPTQAERIKPISAEVF
jgi:hypothetical protein